MVAFGSRIQPVMVVKCSVGVDGDAGQGSQQGVMALSREVRGGQACSALLLVTAPVTAAMHAPLPRWVMYGRVRRETGKR
jgi:hypothetical protein